ncbi:pre-mycofactocin synthase MftD [Patulibacter sp.]|uniref:pre-mycofactocin synthase MftD n=1 Tax=Patulibacter sp. TaxID=1912859 RepID=UPI0027257331|nr:pre-mycofactocin synthase MftD [Patulibacter sp.]MDO9407930.1 mycofactocin biosynthesis FMN-dependent deaminase MftD [Patulibacter sp.]
MASTKDWFESVAEAQRRAKKRLPASVYGALIAGAESGATVDDNTAAFRELGFFPRIATGLNEPRELGTTVMGQELSMPVLVSPTGVQAVHPDGEVAVGRATAAAGTAMGLSSFASKSIEEVIKANPKTFFQVYWMGGRERIAQILGRAKAAGAPGIILTLDWTFAHRRDWGSPAIPEHLDLRAMAKLSPEVLRRPRWLAEFVKSGALPDLTAPNMTHGEGPAPTFFGAYGEWMMTEKPSWDDIAWLREQWDGPFLIKGVTHPDDARRAVDAGASAISVSNHGGNNLDGTPATIRALPAVVDAVGDEVEVLLDGGVRRGSDVVKAVALGAKAVMLGRASLWGLAANGETGVNNVLEIMRAGIDETLVGIGVRSIHDLTPEAVVVPDGFVRRPTITV